MKTRIKLLKRLLVVTLLLSFIGCSEDLYEENIFSSRKIKITKVKFKELSKDEKFSNLISLINSNNVGRSLIENQYGFTISNSNVIVIETDSLTSYTMHIERDENNDNTFFENFVIQEDIFSNKIAAICKYIPTAIIPSYHDSFIFQGSIEKQSIANFSILNRNSYENTSQSDCYVNITMCAEIQPGGIYSEVHVATNVCTNNRFLFTRKIKVICADDFVGGGGGGGSNFDGGFGDTGGGGGGDGTSDDSSSGEDNEIVTSPILTVNNPRPQSTPCLNLNSKSANSNFKQKMRELASDANGVAEAGVVTYKDTPNYGNKTYGGLDSNGNSFCALDRDNNRASQTTGFMHCHLNSTNPTLKTLTVFSLTDFVAYATLVENSTVDVSELGIFVTTNRGTFALKLTDKQAIINLSNFIVNNEKDALKLFEDRVDWRDGKNKQIKGLLSFLSKSGFGTGIELYESDSNFENWKKKSLDANGNIQTTDC